MEPSFYFECEVESQGIVLERREVTVECEGVVTAPFKSKHRSKVAVFIKLFTFIIDDVEERNLIAALGVR